MNWFSKTKMWDCMYWPWQAVTIVFCCCFLKVIRWNVKVLSIKEYKLKCNEKKQKLFQSFILWARNLPKMRLTVNPSLASCHSRMAAFTPCARTVHRPLCRCPDGTADAPPAQTVPRTEMVLPPSDVLIKVGLFPFLLAILETDPLLQSVHVDDTTHLPGAPSFSLTCKWTWRYSSPCLSAQKWWARAGLYT